ncbi:RNA methyltransferase [candidate division KSB1 bacterium]|nr:MAG: RNA methyltransferase [candidate division KSB1 bacterium]
MTDTTSSTPTRRQITEWSRLTQKKFRKEHGQFLIEGDVCVREAVRARAKIEAVLILAAEYDNWLGEFPARVPVFALNTPTFDRFAKVENSQGIVAVANTFELPARAGKLSLACEQVSDPGNCGALIRVADFFGASELHLGSDSTEIWNPKVVRGSMGSLFSQPVRSGTDFEKLLHDWPGSSVAAVAHSGESLRKPQNLKPPILLVLGHETRGLSENISKLCTHHLTLKPAGCAESLNLVTAAAVFAYALT